MSFVLNALAGALTGVLTGFGVGGGTLLILYMTTLAGIHPSAARGINLMYFLPTAGGALVGHLRARRVDRRAFFLAGGAGVVCAVAAAWAASLVDPAPARKIFGAFLIVTGISELIRKGK